MSEHPDFSKEPFSEQELQALRTQLGNVELPPGMMARLEAIPAQQAKPARWRIWGRVAAAVLVVAGLLLLARWDYQQQQRAHLQTLLAEVVGLHEGSAKVAMASGDPDALAKELRAQPVAAGVRADVYAPAEGTQLLGGGTVQVEGKPVYYTVYERKGKRYTLFQAGISTFGLPAKFERERRVVAGKQVETWPDPTYGCGWMLVSSEGSVRAQQLLKVDYSVW